MCTRVAVSRVAADMRGASRLTFSPFGHSRCVFPQTRLYVDQEFNSADTLKDGTLLDHHECADVLTPSSPLRGRWSSAKHSSHLLDSRHRFTTWYNGVLDRRAKQSQQQAPVYGVPAYPPQQPAYAPPSSQGASRRPPSA